MNYWTNRRKASVAVHFLLALGLLIWSTSSSLHFWEFAFKDAIYAVGTVIAVDGLALLGFALYIGRVQSPLAYARHALPFVSALPLVFDMHRQFEHLGGWLTWAFTSGVTALLVALSYVVWTTIEKMFVSPAEAAREHAEEQLENLLTVSESMKAVNYLTSQYIKKVRELGVVTEGSSTPVEGVPTPQKTDELLVSSTQAQQPARVQMTAKPAHEMTDDEFFALIDPFADLDEVPAAPITPEQSKQQVATQGKEVELLVSSKFAAVYLDIINHLDTDPRLVLASLAKRLGVHENTAAARRKELVESGVIAKSDDGTYRLAMTAPTVS